MSEQPRDESFSETHLDSPEYRERLRKKLDCLIAVLDVACAKVRRTLEQKGADTERLLRIQKNLSETLATCQRARQALDRRERLPQNLSATLNALARGEDEQPERGVRARRLSPKAEFSSPRERQRFEGRAAVATSEIRSCDLDELARRLQS
ncbi:MAG: hypothetical protein GC161_04180 [Planctomycetaceae bacterium]|nr:hypothetical protein [Planctomycetaceae bacterium]